MRGEQQKHNRQIVNATYNIRDDRSVGLLSAARALDHANIVITIVSIGDMVERPGFCSANRIEYNIYTYDNGRARKM